MRNINEALRITLDQDYSASLNLSKSECENMPFIQECWWTSAIYLTKNITLEKSVETLIRRNVDILGERQIFSTEQTS